MTRLSFRNCMISSFNSVPFVVSVSLIFLPASTSRFLAYWIISLTTPKLTSGSPPNKSISKLWRLRLPAMAKSIAFFPVSALISSRLPPKSPVPAKQYLQRRLQSWATCRHNDFKTGSVAKVSGTSNSGENRTPCSISSCSSPITSRNSASL